MENAASFYDSLNALERDYWHRFAALFAQVQPKKPEKGIQTLLLRAREEAFRRGRPLDEVLAESLRAATERTERRVRLLNRCRLSEKPVES